MAAVPASSAPPAAGLPEGSNDAGGLRGIGLGPVMKAAAAPPADLDRAALDAEGLAVQQDVSRFTMGGFEDAAECGPRNAQELGCLLLVEAFEIGQTDGFELVQGHDDLVKPAAGDADRLEDRSGGPPGDPAGAKGAGHSRISPPL